MHKGQAHDRCSTKILSTQDIHIDDYNNYPVKKRGKD